MQKDEKEMFIHTYTPQYSQHAESVISQIKDFDRRDFINWFLKSPFCVVGTSHVTNYLIDRKKRQSNQVKNDN